MYIKKITCEDFFGEEYTKTYYFQLSKAEIAEMEIRQTGGMSAIIQEIIDSKDRTKLIDLFKGLIEKSYGERSEDGKRFIKKNPETGRPLFEEFEETNAYSELFMTLSQDDEEAAKFITHILPKELAKDIDDIPGKIAEFKDR